MGHEESDGPRVEGQGSLAKDCHYVRETWLHQQAMKALLLKPMLQKALHTVELT